MYPFYFKIIQYKIIAGVKILVMVDSATSLSKDLSYCRCIGRYTKYILFGKL